MAVVHERPFAGGELTVEAVQSHCGEAEASELRHVAPDRILDVEASFLDHTVVERKRRIVVDAEHRNLVAVVRPAHDALCVDHSPSISRRNRRRPLSAGEDNRRQHRPDEYAVCHLNFLPQLKRH